MNLLVIGHGRMGRLVEALAPSHGFTVVGVLDRDDNAGGEGIGAAREHTIDVAIEFSTPDAVVDNIRALARARMNAVVGTTGWRAHEKALRDEVGRAGTGVVAASNFSLGANVLEAAAAYTAALLRGRDEYGAWLHEQHHHAKKDAPSGTAHTIVDAMRAADPRACRRRVVHAGRAHARHPHRCVRRPRRAGHAHAPGARSRDVRTRGAGCSAVDRRAGTAGFRCVTSSAYPARAARGDGQRGRDTMRQQFTGCGTALVTPFTANGSIDEPALRRLVARQVNDGIHFLVPCGTTGESPTLSLAERRRVVEIVVEEAGGKVPVLAGAGGYATDEVVETAREMQHAGAQGLLSVTPYYNKPTPEGLYRHYTAIALATPLPIIVYNVPGRTGCNVDPATLARLATIPNVVGVKEASGNMAQICEVCHVAPDDFIVLSGDDALTLPTMAVGGRGVISVASNEIPRSMSRMVEAFENADVEGARRLHRQWLPLMTINFAESNPIPVKAALAMMGLIEEFYRLPMVPPRADTRTRLARVLADVGLLSPDRVEAVQPVRGQAR